MTGASRGIGRGIARELARSGALVVGVDLAQDETLVHELSGLLGSPGGESVALDIVRRDDVARVLDEVVAAHGRLDIVVNNAGVGQQYAPVGEMHPDAIDRVVGVNLLGTIHCYAEAVMRIADNTGRIINVASHYGLVGRPNFAPYSASKAGVIALTQCLALEVAARGVTVNAVCPGTTMTEMVEEAYAQRAVAAGLEATDGGRLLEQFARTSIPVGRPASPVDVATTVAWLASDEGSFITGSAVNVSGGETLY